ncbi:hypothetical protein SUGI_0375120 [Cryptomeria japonica]|nr:hypothetical protein SUGI_0375120 [Cryptomeria japonica]
MRNLCLVLGIAAVVLLSVMFQTSLAGRPLDEQGEGVMVLQSLPRGPVTGSCPSGCRNYGSSKGSTGCKCPNGSINVAGVSLHQEIAHPNFDTVSFGVAQPSSIQGNTHKQ